MYTGNVWGIALLISGFLAALIGFQLLLGALAPVRAASALRTLRDRPVGAGFLGVAFLVALIGVAAVAGQFGGPGKFLAGIVSAIGSFAVVSGLGVVSRFVGERMPSPADAQRPWRATLRGGVTCGLAFTTPIVGWFLVLPGAIVMGVGAVALSAFSPAKSPATVPADAGAAA